MSVPELVRIILPASRDRGRPRIVAVDGRSASGKSTLAHTLQDYAQKSGGRSAVVHADDLAWHEPFFAWGHLLRDGVLSPLRRGRPVRFRPPAWEAHGRAGVIDVPAGLDLVIIEGVGASQRGLESLLDATIWVQSDFVEAERRGVLRDAVSGVNGDPEQTVAFWHEWMSHETPFLAEDRPWERARLVVSGTPTIGLAAGEIAVAEAPRAGGAGPPPDLRRGLTAPAPGAPGPGVGRPR